MATPNIRLIRDAGLYHLYIKDADVWLTKSELEELEQIITTCK